MEDAKGSVSGALQMEDEHEVVESNALRLGKDIERSAFDAVKMEDEVEDT